MPESPWNPEPAKAVKFVDLPDVNPKTNEPPKLYICVACGGLVVNRQVHLDWHKGLEERVSSKF